MKVGSIVLSTHQGLGYLAKEFYEQGIITHPIVLRHSTRQNHPEWFGQKRAYSAVDLRKQVDLLLREVDVFFAFETPFLWEVFERANQYGVGTILMPMYECTPTKLPSMPDVMICPSELDLHHFSNLSCRSVYIPVPVWGVEWKQRERAEVFVHNGGNGGLLGRNSTEQVLKAIPLIKVPATLKINSQIELAMAGEGVNKSGCKWQVTTANIERNQLFEGDVFVFPDRFNGLSLPIQEAFASGMGMMVTDRFPTNTYVPKEMMIKPSTVEKGRVAPRFREIDIVTVTAHDIAETINEWYNKDITELSLLGAEFLEERSWSNLKPLYTQEIQACKDLTSST